MKFILKIFFLAAALAVLSYAIYYFFFSQTRQVKEGFLQVDSYPVNLSVLVDGELIGQTPITKHHLVPGYYLVKVADEEDMGSWETKVRITDQGTTKIQRTLLSSENSYGSVISWQPSDNGQAKIAITSTPSGAKVIRNGEEQGVTPLVIDLADAESFQLT